MSGEDYNARLAIAEMKLEQHDKLHEEVQESIKVLSDGITKLVQAEIRREQDAETIGRIFEEIGQLRDDFQKYKDKQTEKELAAYRGIVWKLLGLAALVGASLVAGHWLG